jgi:hypothetical protein
MPFGDRLSVAQMRGRAQSPAVLLPAFLHPARGQQRQAEIVMRIDEIRLDRDGSLEAVDGRVEFAKGQMTVADIVQQHDFVRQLEQRLPIGFQRLIEIAGGPLRAAEIDKIDKVAGVNGDQVLEERDRLIRPPGEIQRACQIGPNRQVVGAKRGGSAQACVSLRGAAFREMPPCLRVPRNRIA